ncbi:hypothetical protein CDL12_14980 [Handroanthus impetiginosus]|uniref:Uncharacterized protein n=1 Tax=Handroanthus impetiginosus TaxID=429701 RepID=A0A2G9H4G2_9LAMI|nr:hypothetical protein CDL12_14980 [Handroanthus impetiginosus]
MKAFGFLCLFLLIGTSAFMYLGYSSKESTSSNPGNNAATLIVKSRNLKDNHNIDPPNLDEDDSGHVNLQDYRPINPVPSSKASIRPKPVQHGTPLMPYVPKPSPPPHPKQGG